MEGKGDERAKRTWALGRAAEAGGGNPADLESFAVRAFGASGPGKAKHVFRGGFKIPRVMASPIKGMQVVGAAAGDADAGDPAAVAVMASKSMGGVSLDGESLSMGSATTLPAGAGHWGGAGRGDSSTVHLPEL